MQLIHYDAACRELAAAHSVDEVKDIRDKSLAMELYARQAMNTDAERFACKIRLRAERRAGEMLKEMERAPAGSERNPTGRRGKDPTDYDEPQVSEYAKAKHDAGVSDSQAKRWQKLAGVPADEFEAALADPNSKPSTSGIIKKANGSGGTMNPDSLWLWGRLRDFEKDQSRFMDSLAILGEMTETMQADVKRIAPNLINLLSDLLENMK